MESHDGDEAVHLSAAVPRPGRRLTLKEVAAALRLSPMTVSNAFNRPDRIAPATRAHVLAEAERLGYPGPDPAARGLRRGRAGAVGIVYAFPLSYAFSDPAAVLFLQGVSLATEAARLGLLLLSGDSDHDQTIVAEATVDGIIAFAMADDSPLLSAAIRRRLPLVLVDQAPRSGISRVGIDDEQGARDAASHVLSLGHRRIAVLSLGLDVDASRRSGPADRERQAAAKHPVARARLRGYAAAFNAAGLPWPDVQVFECSTTTPAAGSAAAAWLLRQQSKPTAILTMSDQLAFGAMDAAHVLGLTVPADLSVVGFDDVPAAARTEPSLTTIRQPHVEKGRRAAQALIAMLRGEGADEPEVIVLPTELVVRESSAPPPL